MGSVRYPLAIPGPGMHVVGVDILAGEYLRAADPPGWTLYRGGQSPIS
ncbi:MAG: hypothetical protein HOY71_00740, partial [Nonomuraea sp.]|nr:hypothetical protein [Nonomuraea sp.]